MARFPIREAEIKSLTQNIVTGLTANAAMYPALPMALRFILGFSQAVKP